MNDKVKSKTEYIVNIILLIGIALSVGVSFYMNCVGRSLWHDESALVYNFITRDLGNIVSRPLDVNQSAPMLYLIVVELFATLLGHSEFVLRLPSFFFYVAMVFFVYGFQKNVKLRYPLVGTLLISSLGFLMMYASECKQYMCEACLAMAILWLYSGYLKKETNRSWALLILLSAIFIWGGNPCCFVIGGVLLTEFIHAIIQKDSKRIITVIISGILVIASFGIYFLIWLKPVIDAGFMTSYWAGYNLPLPFLSSKEELIQGYYNFCNIIVQFHIGKYLVCLGIAFGVVLAFRGKNRAFMALVYLSVIMLVASAIGMFPLADRMWLYYFPIMLLFTAYSFDNLIMRKQIWCKVVSIILVAVIFLSSQGISKYMHPQNVMRGGQEIKPLIAYVEEHIQEGETLFLFNSARYVFEYETSVGSQSIGGYEDNVVYSAEYSSKLTQADIEYISETSNTYIIFYHLHEDAFETLDQLAQKGSLKLVMNNYGTYLYYFSSAN